MATPESCDDKDLECPVCMEPYALVGDHQPRVLVLALARTSYVNSASRRDAAKEVARRATAVQRSVEHPNVNFESQR